MAQLVSRARSVWSGSLDDTLLWLSPSDAFRIRDACENVLVLGGIGSGKTSGPGKTLRRAMFRAGFGALVLVTKPDEVTACLEDAYSANRQSSVIRVDGRSGFNLIEHELARQGIAGINTVVESLMRILEIVRAAVPNGGRTGEAFWENSFRQLLRMTVPILYAAFGSVRISEIIRFIQTAPASAAQLVDEAWRASSFMYQVMHQARTEPSVPLDDDGFGRIASYWQNEFAQLDNKLRTSITSTLSTSLDRFTHGRLKRLFCEDTTFVPELTMLGAIIVLDMSALEWNEDGIIAQQIIKFATQRALLSRNGLPEQFQLRPVAIFVDEAQTFFNTFDREFMSLSRSSRCATVCLTQSIPSVIATIGGDNAKHQADALLAQSGTKIFCNNSCPETNRFAADTVGRAIQRRASFSESESFGRSSGLNMGESTSWGTSSGGGYTSDGRGGGSSSVNWSSNSGGGDSSGRNRGVNSGQSTSGGYSEAMDYEIEPAEFSRSLLTGGPANGGIVSAVWFQAGRRFDLTGRPWLYASFQQ